VAIYEISVVVLTDKFKAGILERELWIDAGYLPTIDLRYKSGSFGLTQVQLPGPSIERIGYKSGKRVFWP
jgi:hypothetical protein